MQFSDTAKLLGDIAYIIPYFLYHEYLKDVSCASAYFTNVLFPASVNKATRKHFFTEIATAPDCILHSHQFTVQKCISTMAN